MVRSFGLDVPAVYGELDFDELLDLLFLEDVSGNFKRMLLILSFKGTALILEHQSFDGVECLGFILTEFGSNLSFAKLKPFPDE